VITPVANAKLRRQSYVEEKQKKKKGIEKIAWATYMRTSGWAFSLGQLTAFRNLTLWKDGTWRTARPAQRAYFFLVCFFIFVQVFKHALTLLLIKSYWTLPPGVGFWCNLDLFDTAQLHQLQPSFIKFTIMQLSLRVGEALSASRNAIDSLIARQCAPRLVVEKLRNSET
jgi:hypothetical protein